MTTIERKLMSMGCVSACENGNHVKVVRKDGFEVYLDKVKRRDRFAPLLLWLNDVRLNGKPKEVIAAVAKVRGIQIAVNYAERQGFQYNLKRAITSIKENGMNHNIEAGK